MYKTIELAYGRTQVALSLDPERFDVTVLLPQNTQALEDPRGTFFEKAGDPIGADPMNELVLRKGGAPKKAVIVIADHTRPVPDRLLVPWIAESLGLDDENITILVGTGTHRGSTEVELERMLGRDNIDRFKIVNHGCMDVSNLVSVGTSACGGACLLHRAYCEADIRIATGFIEPHFFAGFSGGAKAVVPGIASLETILHLHRADIIAHPDTDWGIIDGNPQQALIREMASLCAPDMIVNVTLNLQKEITDIVIGDFVEAHNAGCERVRREAFTPVSSKFPVVVTTNSGYPLDMNFYQTVKGMSAAARIVADGGTIVTASECSQGLPCESDFERILSRDISSPQLLAEIINRPETEYDQWEVQYLLQILDKCRVVLYSSLGPAQREMARVEHTGDIEKTLEDIREASGHSCLPVAILPMGPLTVPALSSS